MKKLSVAERDLIDACLKCVAQGQVIHHDQEFFTIFGLTPEQFVRIAAAWPEMSGLDPADVQLAINNAINNLLGYPHAFADVLETILPATRSELERVFTKWRTLQHLAPSHPLSENSSATAKKRPSTPKVTRRSRA